MGAILCGIVGPAAVLVEVAPRLLLLVAPGVARHAHAREEREQEGGQAGADQDKAALERRPVRLDDDGDEAGNDEQAREDIAREEKCCAHAAMAPSTRSSCSAGFTLRNTFSMFPSGPMTNVERSLPQ